MKFFFITLGPEALANSENPDEKQFYASIFRDINTILKVIT